MSIAAMVIIILTALILPKAFVLILKHAFRNLPDKHFHVCSTGYHAGRRTGHLRFTIKTKTHHIQYDTDPYYEDKVSGAACFKAERSRGGLLMAEFKVAA